MFLIQHGHIYETASDIGPKCLHLNESEVSRHFSTGEQTTAPYSKTGQTVDIYNNSINCLFLMMHDRFINPSWRFALLTIRSICSLKFKVLSAKYPHPTWPNNPLLPCVDISYQTYSEVRRKLYGSNWTSGEIQRGPVQSGEAFWRPPPHPHKLNWYFEITDSQTIA